MLRHFIHTTNFHHLLSSLIKEYLKTSILIISVINAQSCVPYFNSHHFFSLATCFNCNKFFPAAIIKVHMSFILNHSLINYSFFSYSVRILQLLNHIFVAFNFALFICIKHNFHQKNHTCLLEIRM